jgi:hypothetical protein
MKLLSWIKVLQHEVPNNLFAASLKLSSGNVRLTCVLILSLHILYMMPDSLYFYAYVRVFTWWHKAWHSTGASKQAQQLPHLSCYSCSYCLLHIHTHIDHFPSSPATRNKTCIYKEEHVSVCLFFIHFYIVSILTKFGMMIEDFPGDISDIWKHDGFEPNPNCFLIYILYRKAMGLW